MEFPSRQNPALLSISTELIEFKRRQTSAVYPRPGILPRDDVSGLASLIEVAPETPACSDGY